VGGDIWFFLGVPAAGAIAYHTTSKKAAVGLQALAFAAAIPIGRKPVWAKELRSRSLEQHP
jgi:hypothetical protein